MAKTSVPSLPTELTETYLNRRETDLWQSYVHSFTRKDPAYKGDTVDWLAEQAAKQAISLYAPVEGESVEERRKREQQIFNIIVRIIAQEEAQTAANAQGAEQQRDNKHPVLVWGIENRDREERPLMDRPGVEEESNPAVRNILVYLSAQLTAIHLRYYQKLNLLEIKFNDYLTNALGGNTPADQLMRKLITYNRRNENEFRPLSQQELRAEMSSYLTIKGVTDPKDREAMLDVALNLPKHVSPQQAATMAQHARQIKEITFTPAHAAERDTILRNIGGRPRPTKSATGIDPGADEPVEQLDGLYSRLDTLNKLEQKANENVQHFENDTARGGILYLANYGLQAVANIGTVAVDLTRNMLGQTEAANALKNEQTAAVNNIKKETPDISARVVDNMSAEAQLAAAKKVDTLGQEMAQEHANRGIFAVTPPAPEASSKIAKENDGLPTYAQATEPSVSSLGQEAAPGFNEPYTTPGGQYIDPNSPTPSAPPLEKAALSGEAPVTFGTSKNTPPTTSGSGGTPSTSSPPASPSSPSSGPSGPAPGH